MISFMLSPFFFKANLKYQHYHFQLPVDSVAIENSKDLLLQTKHWSTSLEAD
jgi:hypothetical protein